MSTHSTRRPPVLRAQNSYLRRLVHQVMMRGEHGASRRGWVACLLLLTLVTGTLLSPRAQAVSSTNAPAFTVSPQAATPTTRYTNNFDSDVATTIADLKDASGAATPDGIPDYQQDFSPANLDPVAAKANGGTGLTAGQTQLADDGDAQTPIASSVQTDVVSDAATAHAGAFASNSLVIYDGNTGSGVTPATPSFPVFAVDYGDRLVSGTITLRFYDPNTTGSGIAVDFGSGWVSITDSRVANASKTGTVTLKNGNVTATGATPTTGLTYSIGAAHTLTIKFDRNDTSKSPDGTFSYQIDSGDIGTAGYRGAFNPDRFSINNGSFGNTSGATFVDEIAVSGVPEYTAPPTAGVTIDPTSASFAYEQTLQFNASVIGMEDASVTWDVRNARGERITNGGSVSSTGLYTAPNTNGNFYVRAVSVADPSKSAVASVVVSDTGGAPPVKYSNNFNFDTATTLADLKTLTGTTVTNGADGIPDYQQNFNPANLDPVATKANGGTGLTAGQLQVADDGDGQTPAASVQLDVVSDAATIYPGAFDSKSLVMYDGNNGGTGTVSPRFPSFAGDFGDSLASGSMSVKFFDPNATGGVIAVELGNAPVGSTDSRIKTENKVGTVTLKDGKVTALGSGATTGLTYTPNAVHTLTITFDRSDTSKSANGTYTFRIDDGAIGSAGYVAAVDPDRFSINDGSATVVSKATLIDDIVIAGSASGATPVLVADTPVQATVNWNDVKTTTTSLSYGLNGYSAVAPSVAGNATYSRNLSYMKAGLLRFHYGGLLNDSATDARGWTVVGEQRWDNARINEVMNHADNWNTTYGYKPEKLVTIPDFPEWMRTYPVTFTTASGATKTINLLDPSEYDNYAQFCAQLVRILNVDQQRGVKFFEATNERDNIYYVEFVKNNQPDHLDELIEIYNRAAMAMKAVDPTIQVGGPAFTRGDLVAQVRRFVRGTLPNLDFMSYHFYATGNTTDSDEQIYNRTKSLARHSADIAQILREESPDRVIPAHVNEYNISYDFRQPDLRMRGHKGAVFDALSIIASIDTGTSVTNAWNERDGIYGKMDGSNNLRIGAETFQLFNNYLIGDRVATTTSDDNAVVVYAVKNRATNLKSYLVVNRTPSVQRVETNFGDWQTGSTFARYEISSGGYHTGTISRAALTGGEFYVPDHSVTLLTITADDPPVPDRTAPEITITSPAEGATYTVNQQVAAAYNCQDEDSGVALCEGTTPNGVQIDTSSTGTKTFTVNTRDNAGNTGSRIVTYTVAKAMTATNLSSSNPSSTYGDAVTFTANVSSNGGTPTGNVEFFDNSTSIGSVALQDGTASLMTSALNAGSHSITAVYAESENFVGSTSPEQVQNVSQATPVIAVTGGSFTYDAQPHAASGTVTGIGGENLGTPSFTYNNSPDAPVNAGSYAVVASFDGNTNYAAATNNTASITINKAATAFEALASPTINLGTDSTTVSGKISAGALIPSGSVAITTGSPTSAVSTPIQPDGSFSANLPTASLGVSNPPHSLNYTYTGDNNFNAASGGGTLTVTYNTVALYDRTKAHRSGSTVPIKVQLTDVGNANVSSANTVVTAISVSRVSDDASGTLEDAGNANPDNNFRYDPTLGGTGGYIFNLKTTGFTAGTYNVLFRAGNDPTTHSVSFIVR